MKIIRYQDTAGSIHQAALQPDGRARRIAGDIYGQFSVTGETVVPHKLLAPIQPMNLLCIGLNYRRHAEEGNASCLLFNAVRTVVKASPWITPSNHNSTSALGNHTPRKHSRP